MFGKKKVTPVQPEALEVTTLSDGQHVVKIPLPELAVFSPFALT